MFFFEHQLETSQTLRLNTPKIICAERQNRYTNFHQVLSVLQDTREIECTYIRFLYYFTWV